MGKYRLFGHIKNKVKGYLPEIFFSSISDSYAGESVNS